MYQICSGKTGLPVFSEFLFETLQENVKNRPKYKHILAKVYIYFKECIYQSNKDSGSLYFSTIFLINLITSANSSSLAL